MNLLTDPVLRVQTPEGTNGASLPELLALLGEDRVESLPGLQRHQEDAFHIFCCYLAGAVLARAGDTQTGQSTEYWREGIRALTRDDGCADDSAWTMVVENPTKPAFMQSPAPTREVFGRDYKPDAATPDAIDVLITSKNHDVKSSRAANADPEAWLFALISLQTTTGLLGKGSGGGMNRGIGRMNKGYGSRPRVGWQATTRAGAQFGRDVSVLLATRATLLQPPHPYVKSGKVLLWIAPWDGIGSRALASLDPFFIEIARRVRLRSEVTGIRAHASGSAANFIAGDQLAGNLGDPWTPITQKTNGALTVQEHGFTPELLQKLVFGDGYTPAAMQRADSSAAGGWFSASVLVRGQGRTDGFHSATIRVPEKPRIALLGGGPVRDRLALLSKRGLDAASAIHYKALRPALFSLMEGGPESIVLDKTEIAKWVDHTSGPFAHNWNPRYFDWLWSTVDISDDTEALHPWFDELCRLAQETLNRAIEGAPQRHGRTYRATTKAQGMFFGRLKKNFPQFMEVRHDQP
ncbi:type I-E CRISPR-associated protein Cse1/CasA [Accumulibacter sp.]|uniref:type I-E CRISPR-associated protein Cse1/CasA n=1 Tax=Accumulibacter sp. TaxID=2053492 RepID=UPI002622CDAD|nr:type I-E CRISPR-associated protein Cse1/CasA [Accumulibacter sp.]